MFKLNYHAQFIMVEKTRSPKLVIVKTMTVTWTFIKPDGLSDDQFHKQLTNFDSEISNWKSTLERNEK